MNLVVTAALIRLGFLVLWAFFAIFERRLTVLIWALAGTLMAGNIVAILVSIAAKSEGL